MKKEAKPRGRPSKYTPELAAQICDRLAAGESLNAICSADAFPAESTVRGWAIDDTGGFSAKYTRAREIQAHMLGDEIIQIADTPMLGSKTKTNEDGEVEITEGDMIEHRRLRVESRKWYISKVLPKVYGDKSNLDLTNSDGSLAGLVNASYAPK